MDELRDDYFVSRRSIGILPLVIAAGSAHATLIGDEITATWSLEMFSDVNTFVVAAGIDLVSDWGDDGIDNNLDVETASILVDLDDISTGLADGVMWTFEDLEWLDKPDAEIVLVEVETNYTGWDDSFITFDAHSITVLFEEDVRFSGMDDFFRINITTNHQIPEPATLSLMALGLAGLALRRAKLT